MCSSDLGDWPSPHPPVLLVVALLVNRTGHQLVQLDLPVLPATCGVHIPAVRCAHELTGTQDEQMSWVRAEANGIFPAEGNVRDKDQVRLGQSRLEWCVPVVQNGS